MTVALAMLVLAGVYTPHVLRLEEATPALASLIWLCSLVLRALAATFGALFVVLLVPGTELFTVITHWCWDAAIPVVTARLPLDGHALGDAALVMPAFLLAASAGSVAIGLWRTARSVNALVRKRALGPGPENSVILADGDVMVAAAGLRRPQVVVSAGAMVALDDEELAASVAHERAHIERRHRYLMVLAAFCQGLARPIPGTRTAACELLFHVERDADRCALAGQHDPAVLASAICKAAAARPATGALLGLGGSVGVRRVRLLLGEERPRSRELPLEGIAAMMLCLAALGIAALPSAAEAGFSQAGHSHVAGHCHD